VRAADQLDAGQYWWRVTGDRARTPGVSIRDQLLGRLAALGVDAGPGDEPDA